MSVRDNTEFYRYYERILERTKSEPSYVLSPDDQKNDLSTFQKDILSKNNKDYVRYFSRQINPEVPLYKDLKNLVEIARISGMKSNFISYSKITKSTFEFLLGKSENTLSALFWNMKDFLGDIKKTDPMLSAPEEKAYALQEEAYTVVYKCIEHAELAMIQREMLHDSLEAQIKEQRGEQEEIARTLEELREISSTLKLTIKGQNEDLKTRATQLNQELIGLQKRTNKVGKRAKKTSKQIKKINIDAVGMIGLFATIVFAVFGGFTYISSVGQNLQHLRIYKLLIYASLTGILIMSLVFMSYVAIFKISRLDIKSCCKESLCTHSPSEKYPIFFHGLCFYLFLLGIGFAVSFFENIVFR